MVHFVPTGAGEHIPSTNGHTQQTDSATYDISIKNFGPVPATNYQASQKVFLSGTEQHMSPALGQKATLFPTQIVHFRGAFNDIAYKLLMAGKIILDIDVTVEYDGPSGHYTQCDRRRYQSNANAFEGLGECPKK